MQQPASSFFLRSICICQLHTPYIAWLRVFSNGWLRRSCFLYCAGFRVLIGRRFGVFLLYYGHLPLRLSWLEENDFLLLVCLFLALFQLLGQPGDLLDAFNPNGLDLTNLCLQSVRSHVLGLLEVLVCEHPGDLDSVLFTLNTNRLT